MKRSSSRRANSRVPARFCWRERTEKVNWRMLRALHLPDVIKRGDPSVLEPYVLHLTFARLPVSAASVTGADAMENVHRGANRHPYDEGDGAFDQHNAWFIVRIFQLATEYLLFMRSRDGTALETMQKELELCERDCEEFAARTAKWKERAQSGDKQVQKLHQMLQNVAKLLQIQGSTPPSVATIETLLTELVPRQKKRNSSYRIANGDGGEDDMKGDDSEDEQKQIKEARQCFHCGKVFASAVYLEKHHLRRHPGVDREVKLNKIPQHKPKQPTNATNEPIEEDGSREKALRQMLLQVEHALQDHQESLRSLAKEEAVKIQHFYEQLHAENQLAEEIKASRMQAEKKVEEAQQQLESILQEKEDAVVQLGDLKEQIQFLNLKRKMEIQNGIHTSALPASSAKPNISMTLEIKRLEKALDSVNSTLAGSREELRRLQETHLTTLREKQNLAGQLDQFQIHVKRLEQAISELSGAQSIPAPRSDCNTQTSTAACSEIGVQTITEPEMQSKPVPERADAANQTDPGVKIPAIEIGIQTVPTDAVPLLHPIPEPDPTQDTTTTSETRKTPEVTVNNDGEKRSPTETQKAQAPVSVSDYMFNLISESVMDAVTARAQKSLDDMAVSLPKPSPSNKRFSSLSKRAFLRSRFQHDENIVKQRIEDHVRRLKQISQRFGIPPNCNLLSHEHLQVVQQALHGHLEILPTDVLQKMIDCDGVANSIIEKEWIPREKTRQLALDRLKAETHTKSQRNQDLVKLAMLSFASASHLSTPKQVQAAKKSSSPMEARERTAHATGDANQVGNVLDVSSERNQPALSDDGADPKPRFNVNNLTVIIEEKLPSIEAEEGKLLDLRLQKNAIEPIKDEQLGVAEKLTPEPEQSKSDVPSSLEKTESRIQHPSEGIKSHSMRVVTVSPKTSPAKPDRDDDTKAATCHVSESSTDTHTHTSITASTREGSVRAAVTESQANEGASLPEANLVMIQSDPDAIIVVKHCEDESNEIEKIDGTPSDLHARDPDIQAGNSQEDVVEIMEVLELAKSPSMYTSDTYDRSDAERSDQLRHSRSFRSLEFSASLAALSELSFQASIPSLEESTSLSSDINELKCDRIVSQLSSTGHDVLDSNVVRTSNSTSEGADSTPSKSANHLQFFSDDEDGDVKTPRLVE